jgi:hypothetical protein
MAENKTKHTDASVEEFIAAVEHPVRRSDARTLVAMLREVSGHEPRMFGPTIVGFGDHHYRHDTGREGDTPRIAFSPRKANLVFYGFSSAPESSDLLAKLGKHKESKACLYVNKLADVDLDVLRALADANYRFFGTTDKSYVPR